MISKTTPYYSLLMIGLSFWSVQGQQATTAAGGEAMGNGGNSSYSIGQTSYTSITGISGSIDQGVQQAFQITATLGVEETGIQLNFVAYPNPTTDFLELRIDVSTSRNLEDMTYALYDFNGKALDFKKIKESTTTIDMRRYASAVYLLNISENNSTIKTFKIIKN